MQKLTATCYPNNEIRIKAYSPRPRSLKDDPITIQNKLSGNLLMRGQEPLKIAVKQQTHKDKPGYGHKPNPTKFGLNARRTILRIGGVVDRVFGTNAVFLTGTLPGSTKEAMQAISNWSAYIVNRVGQWVRRHSDNNAYFFVWELQKRGALHLHYVAFSNNPDKLEFWLDGWQAFWQKLIDDVSEKSGVDLWQKSATKTWKNNKEVLQAKAVKVEKSVCAYISKYVSKEAKATHNQSVKKHKYYPTRWWGCSHYLRQELKNQTQVIVINDIGQTQLDMCIQEILESNLSNITKSYNYQHKYNCGQTWVIYHTPNNSNLWQSIAVILPTNQTKYDARLRQGRTYNNQKIKENEYEYYLELAQGKGKRKWEYRNERLRDAQCSNEVRSLNERWHSYDCIDAKMTMMDEIDNCIEYWLERDNRTPLYWWCEVLNELATAS